MSEENQKCDLELLRDIKAGDETAKERLVEKYMPMVTHIARNYYASFLEFEDFMQEGFIGLLGAINKYDRRRGVKFSTFAYTCIRRKVVNVLKQTTSNKHKVLNGACSLHAVLHTDDARTLFDKIADADHFISPDDIVEEQLIHNDLTDVLRNHLSELEYAVSVMLLQGYSTREIEPALGLGPKSIDNARTRAKTKISKLMEEHGSLLSQQVPTQVRKRPDLYAKVIS